MLEEEEAFSLPGDEAVDGVKDDPPTTPTTPISNFWGMGSSRCLHAVVEAELERVRGGRKLGKRKRFATQLQRLSIAFAFLSLGITGRTGNVDVHENVSPGDAKRGLAMSLTLINPMPHLETLGGLAMSLMFMNPIMSRTEEMSFFTFLNSSCLS